MKIKENYFFTLREDVKDEESKITNILIRSGMIKKIGSGNYIYLPLGLKVLNNIKEIIKEEINKYNALEIDTNNISLIEDISSLNIKSYKNLPFTLFTINNKTNNILDNHYNLFSPKEFIMNDIYTLVKDEEELTSSYEKVYEIYNNILKRIGLNYKLVEGINSKEYHALTDIGEDSIVVCDECNYKASLDAASHKIFEVREEELKLELIHTPNAHTIEDVCNFLNLDVKHSVKALLMSVDNKLTIFFIRGDRSLNEKKALTLLDGEELTFATDEQIAESNAYPGFTGPIGLEGCKIVIDQEILNMKNFCVGGNKKDYHYINANIKDINYDLVGNIADLVEDDKCPKCGNNLSIIKSYEIGKLNNNLKDLSITYLDENNQETNSQLATFNLNLSRLFTTYTEQNYDDFGLNFNLNIAPYQVALVQIDMKDKKQSKIAEKIYNNLIKKGIEVIYDNRDERPGVKFKDMDLIGIPIRITIGKKIIDNKVELKIRTEKEIEDVEIKEITKRIINYLKG